ncbi:hypothetical protein [Pseudomonas sp. CGJS7]|uniref:hypothetical protein n=1 Tax=Pseudomonas sp. CGJS7 TaxID=3109348 RepID=UPI00300B2FE7
MSRLINRLPKKLALIAFVLGAAISLTAVALPYPGPDEGYIQTYYSDASRTQIVGERSYGNCGESFGWGLRTRHFDLEKIVCGDGLPH